jgi:hypothetical protein
MWHRRPVTRALTRLTLGAALTILSHRVAFAQDLDPRLYPKFDLDASGTLLVLGETIRIDPDSGTGTEIDAEDVLGVSTTSFQPRAALRWRPGRRHRASRSSPAILPSTTPPSPRAFGSTRVCGPANQP